MWLKALLVVSQVALVFSARILGVVPVPSYSHQIVFQPLWRELSLRGHQVVTLTTDPIKDPALTNLTEIDFHYSYKTVKQYNWVNITMQGMTEMFQQLVKVSIEIIDEQFNHPKVQEMLKNESEHFDLLMVEGIWPSPYAFSVRFKCPYIQITTLDAPAMNYYQVGNPAHPILNPDMMMPFADDRNFVGRLKRIYHLGLAYYHDYIRYAPIEDQIRRHFGEGYPSFNEISQNVSLMFVNINPIFHEQRPLLPSIIPIGGGTHFKPSKPIPQDLKAILDATKNGFIYFSLGTNVRIAELSPVLVETFKSTFSELPYTILWKCEVGELPGKPKNVIMSKWFPQKDIFEHPNIKLFIGQGGLQSMEEAIYNHIPLVVMPFFGDQPANAKKIVSHGIGLSLDFTSLEKRVFKETITEVLSNPKYRSRVKEIATLAKDQPMTGLEKAIWWTEYVIRHKGAKHLRSPAMDLPLYQYFLLDIFAFSLFVLVTVVCLLTWLLKFIVSKLVGRASQSKLKKQ